MIALVSGGALLGSTGHSEYTIAWFAAVVGVRVYAALAEQDRVLVLAQRLDGRLVNRPGHGAFSFTARHVQGGLCLG